MYGIYRSKDKSFKLYYNPQAPLKTSYACGSKAEKRARKKRKLNILCMHAEDITLCSVPLNF